MKALAVLLLAQFVPLTQPPRPPVLHGTVERFKDLSPPTWVFDGPMRAAMIVFEPTGFRVIVMQRNGQHTEHHFQGPEKARIEAETK